MKIAMAALCLTTGCATHQVVGFFIPSVIGLAAEGPRDSTGITQIRATGTWKHPASEFSFPTQFGAFKRVAITQYDSGGKNVGVGYEAKARDVGVVLTLFVTPPQRDTSGNALDLAAQYPSERAAVIKHHAAVRTIEEWTPARTPNAEAAAGYAATFRFQEVFEGYTQEIESLLFLYTFEGWVVKYRITYAWSQRERARRLGEAFVSAFRWRGMS
jgi:hypothetical protein